MTAAPTILILAGACMDVVLLTPIRLLADALLLCLQNLNDVTIVAQIDGISVLREVLIDRRADIVLIDITQGVDFGEVRSVATEWPELVLVALGLEEQRQEVIRCGRAGFSGYVPRHATIGNLHQAMMDAVAGRLACPGEISAGLMKALFRMLPATDEFGENAALTIRESDVLKLIGDGLSNKEIARELQLSVATVKHHVHGIFSKLNLTRRADAMRRVRDAPWIASSRVRPPSASFGGERAGEHIRLARLIRSQEAFDAGPDRRHDNKASSNVP
ncbi:response regulator transcription factor [Paraburkholderia sp. RAU2J]|uniref:response regulator transcription factor n=1 Tax=Paraburkholderia sp. RAU2J TaxID=1938810 RepID=UPI001F53F58A|nr:response regulator transcription factor [Paraburkholderia sp. RAU2J]